MELNIKRSAPLRDENFFIGKDGLDVGIFKDADKNSKTVSMMLEEAKSIKMGEQTPYLGMNKYEVVQARKAMKREGKSVPLTAFEDCLLKANINPKTDKVQKFFEYSDIDVLFPEYIQDRAYSSLLQGSIVPEFAMAMTQVPSQSVEKIYLEDDEDDRDLVNIAKLTDLPETRIETGTQNIRLDMYGRYLMSSKIDLETMRISMIDRFLNKVGMQLGIRESDLMIYRLFNGDGNSGTTPGTSGEASASGAGAISFADTLTWSTLLPTPYKMDKFAARKAGRVAWLNRLYDGTTTSIGNDKFNAFPECYEWDRSVITANYFIGVDSRYAIEYFHMGGPRTDTENLVRKVAQGIAIYHHYNFGIADNNAVAYYTMLT